MEIEFVMTQTDAADRCAQQLARRGIHTTICERSGEAALRVILEKRPAMVLLEAFLPELDAIAVKQRCDEAGLTATRFFAMGGFQNEAVEQQLMDAGFLFYFVKPISPEALAQRLAGISGTAARQKGVSDEMQVSEILHQIGVPAHIKGYQFLRDAILLTTGDPEYINAVTKRLYPAIARENATTPSRVERAIRHAIEVAWDRGDVEVLNSYFGYTIHNLRGKPTNSEFIAMIADRMRLEKRSHQTV